MTTEKGSQGQVKKGEMTPSVTARHVSDEAISKRDSSLYARNKLRNLLPLHYYIQIG